MTGKAFRRDQEAEGIKQSCPGHPKKQEMELSWALGLFRIWEVFESKMPLETDFWLSHKTMRFLVWALRK